jgi:transcriptional regulator with XRE-family HTH domain
MNGLEELISTMKRIQGECCAGNAAKMARSLGITLTMLNYIYAGERRPGVRVLMALLRAYPETESYILGYIRFGGSPPPRKATW